MSASKPTFPCQAMPSDAHDRKLLGLYEQRQEGLWMQRVKITGGILSASQWRAAAAIAREFTPDTPLHLTTRQDLELHDVTAEQVPEIHARLHQAGLDTIGTGGDTVRNITVCPCSGVRSGAPDLMPLAIAIDRSLGEYENIFTLPRKFKISLSACADGCGLPWIHDLGFVASTKNGQAGFRVIVAGSLGAKPATGIELFEFMPAKDALPLSLAAVRLFNAQGDRKQRHAARLRHVRQRRGDAAFREALIQEFDNARRAKAWPDIPLQSPADPLDAKVMLTFPNGDLSSEAAEALAALIEQPRVAVRITPRHQVAVFGADLPTLTQAIGRHEALRHAATSQPHIVTCPGNRWCRRGLCNTNALAYWVRQQAPQWPSDKTVCISGCPNGCAHNAAAALGIWGSTVQRDGKAVEVLNVVAGGGEGKTPLLAKPLGAMTREELLAWMQQADYSDRRA